MIRIRRFLTAATRPIAYGFHCGLAVLVALSWLTVMAAAVFAFPIPAAAKSAPVAAAPAETAAPAPQDVQDLLRLLGDPKIVAWLKQNATTTAAPQPDLAFRFRDEVMGVMERTRARVGAINAALMTLPALPAVLADAWADAMPEGETLRTVTYVIIFLFVGGGIEWLYWQYFHPLLVRLEYLRPTTLLQRVMQALGRAALHAGGILLFAVGSLGTFLSFEWAPFVEDIVVNFLFAVIALRTVNALAVFALAPRVAELRLVPLDSRPARTVYRWTMLAAAAVIFGLTTSDLFDRLSMTATGTAMARSAALALAVVFAFLLALALVALVWHIHRHRMEPYGQFHRAIYRLTPLLLSALVIAGFVLWLAGAAELMWTLVIVALTPRLAKGAAVFIDHLFDRAREDALRNVAAAEMPDASPSPQAAAEAAAETMAEEAAEAADRYEIYRPIARRLGRIFVVIAAVAALASVWHTGFLTLSQSPTIAGRLFGVVANITVTLLLADLAWVWARTAIDHRLADYSGRAPDMMLGPEARMATLLPIFRMFMAITVLVIVALTVLSSLGVNIGPLLAGAGVVGIAIGFGAQALVRDVVSGIFFLLDDAFRIGEYIEVGDLTGTVETMSLRSLRVRHDRGAIHTIPFGELKSLTNYSRDWVILKLEMRVPFDTDLKLAKKLVKEIADELMAVPEYAANFIEPLKFQGVRKMEEFNMVVGVKFKTKPNDVRWLIRRDAYQKLRDAFEKHGINFASRNVKVEVVSNRALSDEERNAVVGAAQDAIEQRAKLKEVG